MENSLFSLEGKRVILTGAAGFFGRYFAKALLEAGAGYVYLLDFSMASLLELVKELDSFSFDPHKFGAISIDQFDEFQTDDVFQQVLADGPIDVLINNSYRFGSMTGFNDPTGRVETATKDQVMKSLESGSWWSLRASQLVAPGMKTKGAGSIINIASMYALVAPNPALYAGRDYFNPVGYGMGKAALVAQTRYLAAWLGPEVRVNALAPGAIPNNERQTTNSEQNQNPEFAQRLVDNTLLKRVGHPRDLVGAIIYLASDASSYMTGQTMVVDGGWTTT